MGDDDIDPLDAVMEMLAIEGTKDEPRVRPEEQHFVPGSRKPLAHAGRTGKPAEERRSGDAPTVEIDWEKEGHPYTIGGEPFLFYWIDTLCTALGKSPQSIRLWEKDELFPKASFRSSSGPKGKRLYTRQQIEGLVLIAREEGVLYSRVPIVSTRFPQRAHDLFEQLNRSN